MPSHTQAARVSEGTLDLAICWVQTTDLAALSLDAHLIGMDRLYALCAGSDASPVEAKDTLVVVESLRRAVRSRYRRSRGSHR